MKKLIIFLAYFFIVKNAIASESSLNVSPAIIEKVTNPGEVTKTSAVVTNTTNFPLPIKSQVDAFLNNNNLKKQDLNIFNSASWIKIIPSDFILQPLESKEISIEISPPDNIEPGGHYSTIYFQPLIPSDVIAPNSTISLARIGILTFLIVPGDITENMSIEKFKAPNFQTFGPINFEISLKNNGNIHSSFTGHLTVKDIFGKEVANLEVPNSTVVRGSTFSLDLFWDRSLLFGRYTAILKTQFGANHIDVNSNPLIFWIIPWPLILSVLALLTLLYKIFIVHIDRLKLALKVLKGK